MNTPIDRRSTLLALSGALLAACGGGGSDLPAPQAPAPPTPPPSALALAPGQWSRTFADALAVRQADGYANYSGYVLPLHHAYLGARAFLAGHDAVNAVQRRYAPFAHAPVPDASADASLAYAVAVHDVLLTMLAESNAENVLADALRSAMAAAPPGNSSSRAIEIGRASAAAVRAARADDGSAWPHLPAAFDPTPGVFRPETLENLAWFATWGQVTPFTSAPAATPLPAWRVAPSELTSAEYATLLNEVKAKGRATGSTRTHDEGMVARFWEESPAMAWQRIAANWIPSVTIDLWDAARWCALIQMAIADAEILALEAKYHYRRWRPVDAIREADIDANPATTPDTQWSPLIFGSELTPAYPSAHAAGAWAPVGLMAQLSGGSPATLNVTSSTLPFFPRQLDVPDIDDTVWSEAAREMSQAHLLGGLCDREAIDAGRDIGRLVGSDRMQLLLPRLA
jgi:hypothetical protein